MWFGQAHRAEIAALNHRNKKLLFLLLVTKGSEHVGGPVGQQDIATGANVRHVEQERYGAPQGLWHLHAAQSSVESRAKKTALPILFQGLGDFGNQNGLAVLETWLVGICFGRMRQKFFPGYRFRGIQDAD